MITFDIKEKLAEISNTGRGAKLLTRTSWNGGPAKIDLRIWLTDESGEVKPGRGITLTDEEAAAVSDTLQAYLYG